LTNNTLSVIMLAYADELVVSGNSKEYKMADFHTRSTARSMLNYANQIATMLWSNAAVNGVDTRSEAFVEELRNRWEPAYNRAIQFCRDNGINPKYI